MRHLVILLPAPLLAFLTKVSPAIGNATGNGCPPCPFCL